jgi:hypothetical protein
VIGTGIWIVLIEDWVAFSDVWDLALLVLVGVSMVLGMAYFGPEGRRIGRIADERGAEDAEFRQRMDRLLLIGRVDLVILAVVLWLMVFKPGVEGSQRRPTRRIGTGAASRFRISDRPRAGLDQPARVAMQQLGEPGVLMLRGRDERAARRRRSPLPGARPRP